MNNRFLFKLNSNQDIIFNMLGDYTYLTEGYYISLDEELNNTVISPTSEEALDAYIVPLAMEKAKLNDIPIPDYEIFSDKIIPPVIAYPMNPYTSKFEIVNENDDLKRKFNAVTMSGKYATLCQKLPNDYRIDVIRSVLGKTLFKEYGYFSEKVFEAFKIPLMKIRVIVTHTKYLFSAIEPLNYDELTLMEKRIIEESGAWQK